MAEQGEKRTRNLGAVKIMSRQLGKIADPNPQWAFEATGDEVQTVPQAQEWIDLRTDESMEYMIVRVVGKFRIKATHRAVPA